MGAFRHDIRHAEHAGCARQSVAGREVGCGPYERQKHCVLSFTHAVPPHYCARVESKRFTGAIYSRCASFVYPPRASRDLGLPHCRTDV
jgi:hypothetical protein